MIKDRMSKVNQVAQADTTRLIHQSSPFRMSYHVDSIRTGKPYQVTLEWTKDNGFLILTGFLYTFDHKEAKENKRAGYHPANDNKAVCYQVLGAIKKMAADNGKTISFCEDEKAAFLVSQFGGEIFKIKNFSGRGVVWAVVKDTPNRAVLNRNVALMRQPEDSNYID